MTPESLLEQFGYLAVFLGTFLEGEAILVAAGFFASRGLLHYPAVVAAAFCGSFCGHLFWFWLGRAHGVRLLDRYDWLKRHLGRGIRVFERYGPAAIFMTQWLYGLRITCAVIIGMSLKFVLYESLSCALWAIVISAAGLYFGKAIEAVLGRVEHLEKYGLAVIVAVALMFWLIHRRKDRPEVS
jgi:membrane protein DedA with SNARE-associated domain